MKLMQNMYFIEQILREPLYTGPIGTALHRSSPCKIIGISLKRVPCVDKDYGGYRPRKSFMKTAFNAQIIPTTLWTKMKSETALLCVRQGSRLRWSGGYFHKLKFELRDCGLNFRFEVWTSFHVLGIGKFRSMNLKFEVQTSRPTFKPQTPKFKPQSLWIYPQWSSN